MVLQRDRRNVFWGWTTPGAAVTVSIEDHKGSGVANALGKWEVQVSPPKVGGPYKVEIDGPQHVELNDVLVGDVWICSGQSNMEFGIGNGLNAQQEIANANYPNIRIAMANHDVEPAPKAVNPLSWAAVTPQSIAQGGWNGFSAVAYFFGRELNKRLNVPIGLVQTVWGGTIAEAWTSKQGLLPMHDFDSQIATVDAAAQAGKTLDQNNPNVPTVLYNGMIYPLQPLAIKGAIWYQGESNAGRAEQYKTLLPTMIGDWRREWHEGDFPFFIVQLANFQAPDSEPKESDWAELREAQTETAKHVKNGGLALAIDIGDANDIHPKDKQDVGLRLALAALHVAYHQNLAYSGPTYKSQKIEGNSIRLSFDNVDGGLKLKGDGLKGFAIAGADHKYHWADAKIDGNSVVVSSAEVTAPVAVRYDWGNNPNGNLYNAADLPTVPFKTDDWPWSTAGRK